MWACACVDGGGVGVGFACSDPICAGCLAVRMLLVSSDFDLFFSSFEDCRIRFARFVWVFVSF